MYGKTFALVVALIGFVAAQQASISSSSGPQGSSVQTSSGGQQGSSVQTSSGGQNGGTASAQARPECAHACQQTSQKDAYDKADIVAAVKINQVQTQNDQVEYQADFLQTFKPKGQNASGSIIQDSNVGCGGARLAQNVEYLIAAKREGQNLKIEKCSQIPLANNGISTGPLAWLGLQNNQQFRQGLDSGFEQSSSGAGGMHAGGGMGGQGASVSTGSQQGGQGSSDSSSMSASSGGGQQSGQDSQSSQGGQQSGSSGQDSQSQGGQQSGQESSGQDSQSQGGQQSGQQSGQDSQSQGGQQSGQQSGQDSQSQGGQQSGQDSQSQGSSQQSGQGSSGQQQPQSRRWH